MPGVTDAVDAVVVGAGPNGLVAANLLADAGWDVVVLEAASTPGGAVRSANVTAPGFLSDLCSAFYPLAAAGAPLQDLGLEDYGLRWRRAPTTLAHVLPDGSSVSLENEVGGTAESVSQFSAEDGRRWTECYQDWIRAEPALLDAIFSPFPPLRATAKLLRGLGVGDTLRLARRGILPVDQLGRDLFQGEGARLLLAGCALHADLAPAQAASGMYGWLLAMLGQHHGFPVPQGGAGRLTEALVGRLMSRGGVVHCGENVVRIAVNDGRAVGVQTQDGHRWRARRAVVADVAAPALYLRLLDRRHLPRAIEDDLRVFRRDWSTVKVDWALAGPVPWSSPAARSAGTIHLGVDLNGLVAFGAALEARRVPDEPFLLCGQMTICDDTRSPSGTESLWAYTHLPHRRRWGGDEVAATVARMECALEQAAPGFRATVIARNVSGPAQLEAENANLVGGSIAGGTAAIDQQLIFRPVPGLGRADTPIDRLFLASASAHPGGGVHGGPGANAARAALARSRAVTGTLYGLGMRRLFGLVYPPKPRAQAPDP